MSALWRIAIASSDRETINVHFGQATTFSIVDLKADGSYVFSEERTFPSAGENGHSDEIVALKLQTLADCDVVLAEKVGLFIRRALEKNGVTVLEENLPIDVALPKVAKYLSRRKHTSIENT